MNSRSTSLLAFLVIAAVGTGATNAVMNLARRSAGEARPGERGGIRAIAADVCWLRTYQAWRKKDEALTGSLIRRTLAWDPQSDLFWLNGARILADDFPAWRAEREPLAPRAAQEAWRREAAQAAISLLREGLRQRGPRPDLLCEIAVQQWHGLGNLDAAAESYLAAAVLPGAPWHAGRLRAEALLRQGRREEARQWLRFYIRLLPADDPAAQRSVVAARLAGLESEAAKQ